MSLIRRLSSRSAIVAFVFAAAAASEMKTTNAMPTTDGGKCTSGQCPQGGLFGDAMMYHSESFNPVFAYSVGKDFGGTGWPAGVVSDEQATAVYKYSETVCDMKLRGLTLIRIINALMSSEKFAGSSVGTTSNQMLQFSGMKVKYSSTLPANKRLLSLTILNKATGSFVPVNRTALYKGTGLKFDYANVSPYKAWTKVTKLADEHVDCFNTYQPKGKLAKDFLNAKSPYDIPDVTGVITSEAGGTAMVVEQDAEYCKTVAPPAFFKTNLASCVPCAPGQTSDGATCTTPAGTPAPTAAPTTPVPAVVPITPVPAAVPASPVPANPSSPTGSPASPAASSDAPAPSASDAASGASNAAGAATPAPGTGVPGVPSGSQPAGRHGGASAGAGAAPTAGGSAGLIAGIVVGCVALVAIGAAVAFVIVRRRSASDSAKDGEGLEANLNTASSEKDDSIV